jgi:hypothetical protein
MIATIDVMFLVFSARSQLKDAFKILHLRALVTVSNFEKINSDALRKFTSYDQATTRQPNLRLK